MAYERALAASARDIVLFQNRVEVHAHNVVALCDSSPALDLRDNHDLVINGIESVIPLAVPWMCESRLNGFTCKPWTERLQSIGAPSC